MVNEHRISKGFRLRAALSFIGGVLLMLPLPPAFSADTPRVSNGLAAFYTFESGHGDTIKDRSGNGQPVDLKIEQSSAVAWKKSALEVRSATKIESIGSADKIVDQAKRSNALTIEAWIKPNNTSQKGPARIVSMSKDSVQRNFTLGQDGNRYQIRLRTTLTSDNGIPETSGGSGNAEPKLTHVVFTRDGGGNVRVYENGKQTVSKKVAGKLSNWEDGFLLILANERSSERPWLGEFYLVAIYSRALDHAEVSQNFDAGPKAGVDPREAERLAMAKAEQTFATKIAPLFARHCLECHDSASKKGELDLSRKVAALAGGESGSVIVPGNAEESLLWEQIASGDMPPQGPGLSTSDQMVMKGWIDGGAVWSIDMIDPAVYASKPGASDHWIQRLTVLEYIETVRSAVGVNISAEATQMLPPDLRADGFSNTAYNLNVDLKHVEAYSQLAELIVQQMDILKFAKRFSKSRSLNTDATARDFVAKVGEWLFRGPLDEREVSNYSGVLTAVASAGGSFEQGVGLMVEAMLQSPRFIYRIEKHPHGGGSHRVSDFELASRMSYILWGGPPDAELLKAAREGQLTDEERCRAEVERMLNDRRAVERSKQFASDWLNLDRLTNMQPNQKRYPGWKPELGRDMRDETLAYFEEVVWKQGRPLNELFDAQFTFATPQLAKHYGLEPKGDGLRRYDLSNEAARGGLLTQGSVLTIGGDDASMVTRGLFVMRDLLRGVIGAPPPGVDTTPVPPKPGMTHRDVAEDRIRNESCGGCHIKFDPLAFGLEQFDGLGGFHRKDEFGNALRSDGQLVIPGEAKVQKYKTPAELMKLLSGSDRVRETLTWKVTQFALGRPLGARDATEVQRIHQTATNAGGRYADLITAIVMSDLVQETRSEEAP
ncbi:hypothetical protein CEE69_14190 [Rhodopirellula bahusiensis]|uniref:Cytochrome c domain-containing protein n=2 Tax=Rhodopirellula bahusiensis TaxID=2014065 RepID=A0A2G1W6N3_9BACT|nr:hypothetical protein CEE69_14190 [Rhodopirellula bahusiensis]